MVVSMVAKFFQRWNILIRFFSINWSKPGIYLSYLIIWNLNIDKENSRDQSRWNFEADTDSDICQKKKNPTKPTPVIGG